MGRIALKDIAEATGFSCSTVGAALKNRAFVKERTRDIICKKANELGYTPDPIYSELGRQKWKRSGSGAGENLIFLTDEKETFFPEFFAELVLYAQSKGYALSSYDMNRFNSCAQADREFRARGIRGILSTAVRFPAQGKFITELNTDHIAIVSGEMNRTTFHSIAPNWVEMVYSVIHELCERGYQRISIIFGENKPFRFCDMQRFGAVLFAQQTQPAKINLHTYTNDWGAGIFPEQGRKKELLKQILQTDQPDAIIGWAEGDYWILRDLGCDIPNHLGYICMMAGDTCSGLNSILLELWKLQLDRLIALIHNHQFGVPEHPVTTLYTPRFIDQGTLAPRLDLNSPLLKPEHQPDVPKGF